MADEGVTVLARHRELKGFHRIAAKAHDIVPLGINRKLPRVDAGNVQEVADEPVHPCAEALDALCVSADLTDVT